MLVSNIFRQPAYSGVHRVKTNGGKDVVEQPVPAVLEPGLQERAMTVLEENSRYRNRKNDRRYLLGSLVRCATCGRACTGHNSEALTAPVTLGIVLGLVVGKQLGITLSAWLAVRSGLSELPEGLACTNVPTLTVAAVK